MAIRRDGYRYSQLSGCIPAATDTYLLSQSEAKNIIAAERDRLWGRQILNPYALEDAA